MKWGIQDLSFQFRSLREWVSFAVVGRLLEKQEERKEAEEALGSQYLVCLGPANLSGQCSKRRSVDRGKNRW